MKVSAVISRRITDKNKTVHKYDKLSLVIFCVLAMGLFSGVIIYILAENYLTGKIWEYFINFSTDFSNKSSLEILSGFIISHMPYILLTIIFGTSIFGAVPITLMGFVKTMGMGLIGAYMYSTYLLKGIEYSFIILFPGKFILLFSMLIIMRVCLTSTENIRKLSAGESETKYSLSEYWLKSTFGILLFVLSSVIDCMAVVCFSSLFSFV